MRTVTILICLTAIACSSETSTYSAALDDGSGGVDSGDASTAQAVSPVAGGAIAAGGATVATSEPVEAPELLCVPGQSVSCACSDGASSAQVCAEDGQSFGACDCGPAEVVMPNGYSGECVLVGYGTGWCPEYRQLYVNCPAAPSDDNCFVNGTFPLHAAVIGAFCC